MEDPGSGSVEVDGSIEGLCGWLTSADVAEELDAAMSTSFSGPSATSESTPVAIRFMGLMASLSPINLVHQEGQVAGVLSPHSVPDPVRGRIRSCDNNVKQVIINTLNILIKK